MTGKIVCKDCNGRKAINWPAAFAVVRGTGAPESMNRDPITPGKIGLIAGHALPSFGEMSGLPPVNAVEPPLEAKNA